MNKGAKNAADKDNWDILKAAILQCACEDYINAKNGFLHPSECPRQRGYNAQDAVNDLKRFFRSKWFTYISDIDSEYLIRGLNEKARMQNGKKMRSLTKEVEGAVA